MRRILLLLAIAAMILALTAGPALAVAREPTEDVPGDPQTPTQNPANLTEQEGENCYGQLSSNNNKGPGGNPGSLAEPTTFDPDAEGPLPEQPDYTGHAVSSLDPGDISGFQQDFAEDAASCGDTGTPT